MWRPAMPKLEGTTVSRRRTWAAGVGEPRATHLLAVDEVRPLVAPAELPLLHKARYAIAHRAQLFHVGVPGCHGRRVLGFL